MWCCSHLGEAKPALGISSHELVAATSGIDVVLDGHTHSVIERDDVMNLDGVLVPVTQTGTQFANVGKLVITADGHISTTLIAADDIPYESDSLRYRPRRIRCPARPHHHRGRLKKTSFLHNLYKENGGIDDV